MAEFVAPAYVEHDYWWAYNRPWAVKLFDHQLSVNTILYGNYNRLRDAALATLGDSLPGKTLQIGCCYGNLTPHILERVARGGGTMEVIDVLAIQTARLRSKVPAQSPLTTALMDGSALQFADASFDRIIIFMLLHEMPESVRQKTFSGAMRVLRPGGRLVIVDYAKHVPWHPLRPYLRGLLAHLKPYVIDVFEHPMDELIPAMREYSWHHEMYFGNLFQLFTTIKPLV